MVALFFSCTAREMKRLVTFLSTTDTSGQVNGCLNKTLQQLIANGQTYSFLNTSDLSKFITEYQKQIADIGLLTDKLKIADQQVQ